MTNGPSHPASVPGRARLAFGRDPAHGVRVDPGELAAPDSVLARDAHDTARELLSPPVFEHSRRTYAWAAALAAVHRLEFDREAVYVASLLHDACWPTRTPGIDFTVGGSDIAADVAERHHLEPRRRALLGDAICMHHTPGVTLDAGPEAFLLASAAALDVVGLRLWDIPENIRTQVISQFPRTGFKRECARRVRAEAAAVPHGRMWLFHRYGLSDLTIATAPFED
ncbi:HD domain-containing protein [Nocardia blacklockiae]|uniref:HD domain-containing protein n=1 Tax=Nocardia blacklockiae TaxID=480036 RepID=UPI00189603D0|nr:HD domain-containing protein [Nocardia blacklockiae]MBF6170339.1 HD domain-containing protein [Nocardia blacklockiae]